MLRKCVLAAGICAVAGFGVAQQASAVSPYDLPYNLQWSFQTGDTGSDLARDMAVTDDGIVHLLTRTSNTQTFGEGPTNSVNSDIGGVDPLGNLVYGITISGLPGIVSPSQNYAMGVNASGNKAYFGTYSNNNAHWNDPGSIQDPVNEIGKASNHPMTWSINSASLAKTGQTAGNASLTTAIDDRVSLSIYSDNAGTPRVDGNGPITTGMSQLGIQLRGNDSALRASTLDMIMVNDMVNGDFGTLGDYGGYNLRNSGTANAYMPGIGRYNHTTKVLDGPAKQPVVLDSVNATFSNFATYLQAGVDQATGWYYGGGLSHARGESTSTEWDPDGTGPSPVIPFANSFTSATTAGIGTAYDASNMLQYAVTWDSAGVDLIYAIGGTNDGSNAAIWAGEKGDNAYFEKRDSTGGLVWGVDLDMSTGTDAERVTEVEVDAAGNVWVSGYFTNSVGGAIGDGSGEIDAFLAKYDSSGTEIWRRLVAGGGASDINEDADFSKYKAYLYTSTNGQWANTTGYVNPDGNNDNLLQKFVPGDQNADGIVDVDDACAIGLAVHPGANGVDTWDFNEDGNSTPADYIFFVENVLDWTRGDNDLDGDVDTQDLTGSIISFTGAVGAAGGKCHDDGDTDGDGDVDTADLTTSITNFTGALAGNPNVPDLVYDPATGNVTIDADGADVISFSLQSGPFNAADFSELPAGLTDNIAAQIGWTSFNLFTGLTGTANLGNILPAGLDQAGLEAALTTASYGLALAGGGGGGRLDLIIPEPASMVLMGLGAVALVRRRRAA